MPPKKKAAAKPPPRMPRKLPTSYTNGPLQPRRGWKGPPLPFTDIDGALAWGFGNEKLEDAQDQAVVLMASDAHHRERAQVAEKELESHPKRGARGRYISRNTLETAEELKGERDPNPIIAEPVQKKAPKAPPPAPKKDAPQTAPEPPRPTTSTTKPGEMPADASAKRAHEKAEEAQIKEELFRARMKEMEQDLAAFREKNKSAKKAMPAELKERRGKYTQAALKKLTAARVAAVTQANMTSIVDGIARQQEGQKK
jgi:hypothetical protein